MNPAEGFLRSYYEGVLGYATRTNVRFRGPGNRNWSDIDLVAMPIPPTNGRKKRTAHIVESKWRARHRLSPGDETWLVQSVAGNPLLRAKVKELLGDWPYEIVLVTTTGWIKSFSRPVLAQRLSELANATGGPTCRGARLLMFQELHADWQARLVDRGPGWADDAFAWMEHLLAPEAGGPATRVRPDEPEAT